MLLIVLLAACGGIVTHPSSGALVSFDVQGETFRVWLTAQEDIDAAKAARAGGPARIPNGRIVAGTRFNYGWSWHLVQVEFAEVAMELCDGRPSDVEREGTSYGGGRFCPWGAEIIRIEEY
jgi:hypothetical protein